MVDDVVTGQKIVPNINSFGVAICGPNVTAASIVIPKCVTNPKMLTDYMKEVSDPDLFMFIPILNILSS